MLIQLTPPECAPHFGKPASRKQDSEYTIRSRAASDRVVRRKRVRRYGFFNAALPPANWIALVEWRKTRSWICSHYRPKSGPEPRFHARTRLHRRRARRVHWPPRAVSAFRRHVPDG